MANTKQTYSKEATAASKILKSKSSTAAEKGVAGSDLSQARGKGGKRK